MSELSLERIAAALERIADALEASAAAETEQLATIIDAQREVVEMTKVRDAMELARQTMKDS